MAIIPFEGQPNDMPEEPDASDDNSGFLEPTMLTGSSALTKMQREISNQDLRNPANNSPSLTTKEGANEKEIVQASSSQALLTSQLMSRETAVAILSTKPPKSILKTNLITPSFVARSVATKSTPKTAKSQ